VTFEVTRCETLEEFTQAVYAIGQYFSLDPTEERMERFSKNLPIERMHAAREDGRIVGGAGAFPFELTVPGGRTVRTAGVTVVGTYPTHRRRGVLRAMMRAQLDDVHERGEPVALLWASEETIYGRFGYGMASHAGEASIPKEYSAFARPLEREGVPRIVERDEALRLFPQVWDRVRRRTPGMLARTRTWWEYRILFEQPGGEGPKRLVVLEHDGRPTGYAVYRHKPKWEDGVSQSEVEVVEAVALDGRPRTLAFDLERWVDPARLGWWSGDHHIHAAGCAHYTNPTEGVHPPDMLRHCQGEDLKVGCALTWGPCFDYQKQFFTGAVDAVSKAPYLLRYDIEVSGFGSHQSGHLCLLRLKEQIYPGGDSKNHWPTLGLNTLRWAKKQGAVCGPAHSGWGLEVETADLPHYTVPPFNGIGANEYIVDVTHEVPGPDGKPVPAVDFISTVDTPYVWELNIWYHTLNCGFRTRASGETDFPCIYGERVGLGRSYVKLNGKLDFDRWCEGIRQGRSYVGDGRSHLMEFRVNDREVGEAGSELRLSGPETVRVTAKVAALLSETPDRGLKNRRYTQQPYWHLERARIGESREVPVEVVVNGLPVARQAILADGKTRDLRFDVQLERSSWVALRILPSSHTNPVFVLVGGKPIRASKKSAEWCLKGVDQCWQQKRRFIREGEMASATAAYDHARATYRRIAAECDAE